MLDYEYGGMLMLMRLHMRCRSLLWGMVFVLGMALVSGYAQVPGSRYSSAPQEVNLLFFQHTVPAAKPAIPQLFLTCGLPVVQTREILSAFLCALGELSDATIAHDRDDQADTLVCELHCSSLNAV